MEKKKMALTRKMLKAIGIGDEIIDQIIEAHTETVDALRQYKTDAEQFGTGIEKTFFCEEMFYYPFCDCEDRAVLYSYLVHNLLGFDVVLLEYPGHECTAVAFPEPLTGSATSITYQGRTWYICDPTYIGSDIGMCIPRYVSVQPQVSTWY